MQIIFSPAPRLRGRALAALLCLPLFLNGCLIDQLIKSPRALHEGYTQTNYAAALWTGSVTQKEVFPSAGPTPTAGSGYAGTGVAKTTPIQFWTGGVEYRLGSKIPGMELGMAYDYAGSALMGDLKYQFLGFEQNDKGGPAAALDGEVMVNLAGAYGFAGTTSVGVKAGFVDLILGARLGTLMNNKYGSSSSSGYDYSASSSSTYNSLYLDPSDYSYYDLYGGAEFEFLEGMDLQFGATYRIIANQPYLYRGVTYYTGYPSYTEYSSNIETSFPSLLLFTITVKNTRKPYSKDSYKGFDPNEGLAVDSLPGSDVGVAPRQNLAGQRLHIDAGRRLIGQAQYQVALQEYIAAEQMGDMSYDLAMGMGYCYYMRKDWESALYYYEKAKAYQPTDARLHQTVTQLRLKVSQMKAAPATSPSTLPAP
jgi:tetratricopeptide (TPR) repeat protein